MQSRQKTNKSLQEKSNSVSHEISLDKYFQSELLSIKKFNKAFTKLSYELQQQIIKPKKP